MGGGSGKSRRPSSAGRTASCLYYFRLGALHLRASVASAQGVVELRWGAEFIAQARRNGAVDVGDAEPGTQLRADYRATGVAHHVVLRVEGGDHAAGELWGLPLDRRPLLRQQGGEMCVGALG